MHTSYLESSAFRYWRIDGDQRTSIDFGELCPDYAGQDRVGIVSPRLEDGVLHVAGALMSLTAAFYAGLRSSKGEFFDYPQHFAFLGGHAKALDTRHGPLPVERAPVRETWGNLDVWPGSNRVPTPATATRMMQNVLDTHINRLFWPDGFVMTPEEKPLPAYVCKMFRTRLKAVWFYNPTNPNLELQASRKVDYIVRKSLAELPKADGDSSPLADPPDGDFPIVERFRQISVDDFLEEMGGCFESE